MVLGDDDMWLVETIDTIVHDHIDNSKLRRQLPAGLAPGKVMTIEWHMMDKKKYYPLNMASSLTIRCLLYPFTVIKTRLQIQRQKTIYNGTFDAFYKIVKYEGVTGLYKGFWINSIQVVTGLGYITTYEGVRHLLTKHANITDSRLKGLIAGAAASLVGQTIIVPFDVVSQHMMMMGQFSGRSRPTSVTVPSLGITVDLASGGHRFGRVSSAIIRELYLRDGIRRGFYRGLLASLMCLVPNSGLWWMFYSIYTDTLSLASPTWVPHLVIQCTAAPLGGVTTALITNPLDVLRARLQVERRSWPWTIKTLWRDEQLAVFTKGLSARMIQSVCFSFFIILGYESVKRWSVNDEYKSKVHW